MFDLPTGFNSMPVAWRRLWPYLQLCAGNSIRDDRGVETTLNELAEIAGWDKEAKSTVAYRVTQFCKNLGIRTERTSRGLVLIWTQNASRLDAGWTQVGNDNADNKEVSGNIRTEVGRRLDAETEKVGHCPQIGSLPPQTPLSLPSPLPLQKGLLTESQKVSPLPTGSIEIAGPNRGDLEAIAPDFDDSLIPDVDDNGDQFTLSAVEAVAPALTPEALVDLWNGMVQGKLPGVRMLNAERTRRLRAAITAVPRRDDWKTIIGAVLASEWHCGANDRGWRADLTGYLCNGGGARAQEILEMSQAPALTALPRKSNGRGGSDHPLSNRNIDRMAADGSQFENWREWDGIDPETRAALEEAERVEAEKQGARA